MEEEIEPPGAMTDVSAVVLESWFYTFADSVLDKPAARFQIGLFDFGETFVLAVKQLGIARASFVYYKIAKENSESRQMMETAEAFISKIEELRLKIAGYARSDRFTTTIFGQAKSVTFIFDDRESIVLGRG